MCPGVEEWLRCFVYPEVVVCAGGLHSTLFLVQDLQKWQFGFFGLFVSFCPEFAPATPVGSYFQSYTVSLYFVAQGEVCPSASTAAKGPRVPDSQSVSFPAERLYILILRG